jgi:hypothetical protein
VRPSNEVHDTGLFVSLGGYQTSVLLDIHERSDNPEGDLARLERELGGEGVPNIEQALMGLELRPAQHRFAEVATADLYRELDNSLLGSTEIDQGRFSDLRSGYRRFLEALAGFESPTRPIRIGVTAFERILSTVISLPHMDSGSVPTVRKTVGGYVTGLRDRPDRRRLVSAWTLTVPVIELYEGGERPLDHWGLDGWVDLSAGEDPEWLRLLLRAALRFPSPRSLAKPAAAGEPTAAGRAAATGTAPGVAPTTGAAPGTAPGAAATTGAAAPGAAESSGPADEPSEARALIEALVHEPAAKRLIRAHSRDAAWFYDEQAMKELLWAYAAFGLIRTVSTAPLGGRTAAERIHGLHAVVEKLLEANRRAAGNLDRLRSVVIDSGAESGLEGAAKKKVTPRKGSATTTRRGKTR